MGFFHDMKNAFDDRFHKFRKYSWVILAIIILLLLCRAIIFPNTLDIVIVTFLFILLLAILEKQDF